MIRVNDLAYGYDGEFERVEDARDRIDTLMSVDYWEIEVVSEDNPEAAKELNEYIDRKWEEDNGIDGQICSLQEKLESGQISKEKYNEEIILLGGYN